MTDDYESVSDIVTFEAFTETACAWFLAALLLFLRPTTPDARNDVAPQKRPHPSAVSPENTTASIPTVGSAA